MLVKTLVLLGVLIKANEYSNKNKAHLIERGKNYKEGVFWVAYEQSAYACFLQKTVKPTKKHIKIINAEVVKVGFPEVTMVFFKSLLGKIVLQEYHFISFETASPLNKTQFEEWKKALPVFEPASRKKTRLELANNPLIDNIKQFDVVTQTPMAAMLFITELKKMINNGNL